MFKGLSKMNFKWVTTKPKMVLVITLLLTIAAGVLASGLSLELNWVSLAPKGNEAVQEYQQIIEDFPSLSNIIVVVEGDDVERLEAAVSGFNVAMVEKRVINPFLLSVIRYQLIVFEKTIIRTFD